MPLNAKPLELDPDPRSVQAARRWVVGLLRTLGRDDLLECAELGVSELVTNALLHAEDPITVRVRGTTEHPRLEVSDGSRRIPEMRNPGGDDLDALLATFGRGLDLVARCSVAWGTTIENDGKVVWFEPASDTVEDVPPEGTLVDVAESDADEPLGPMVPVRLQHLSVATMLGLRRHYHDLRRELRILSLAHADSYPLAGEVIDVFARFDAAIPTGITAAIDGAAAQGDEVIDLDLELHTDTSVFSTMLELLDLADEFCRTERLLSLARSPHQKAFQEWLLGEFIRQAQGAAPRPWPGRTEPEGSGERSGADRGAHGADGQVDGGSGKIVS